MGACGSTPHPYEIICDTNGIIQDVTPLLLAKLGYNMGTLHRQFIGVLMNDFMSMLHKKYYIQMFRDSVGKEKNLLENKLKSLNHKRPLIIYDINMKAHHVSVSIHSNLHTLYIIFEFLKEDINNYYTITRDNVREFRQNKGDSIIIMTDFIQSTELLEDKGAINLINSCVLFNEIITELIRDKYFPFIYLHETLGDSFVFTLNTDWTYNIDRFCATLAINFIFDLVQKTRHFIKIRTGIGYGKIHYGRIGNAFRFFGRPMNIASRLENKCSIDTINVCQEFYKKLKSELDFFKSTHSFTKRTEILKGFGETSFYTINVSESSPFLVY